MHIREDCQDVWKALQDLDGLVPIRGLNNVEPRLVEGVDSQHAYERLVLDNEDHRNAG